jgi:hypothetical protein
MNMRVFLGWSGNRSKEIAKILKEWLPPVIQAVDPWMSPDMEKGIRWEPEIAERLAESRVGIIILTEENLNEPWILFEAGALSREMDTHVCTFLLDISPTDIENPLAQFQHTRFKRDDIWKLVLTINKIVNKVGERSLSEDLLNKTFNTYWPQLEEKFQEIVEQKSLKPQIAKLTRKNRETLKEIFEIARKTNIRPDSAISYISSTENILKKGSPIEQKVDRRHVRNKERETHYEPNRGIFLVHKLTPSKIKDQLYDILIYLIPHKEATLTCIQKVEYYFGPFWNDRIFISTDRSSGFSIATSAYGPFVCTAEIHFTDGSTTIIWRYIDFEMGTVDREVFYDEKRY